MKAVPANRYVIYFSLAILGCLVDLATKSWVFNWLGGPGERPPWWIVNDVFGFQTSLNEGALFGMGQGFVHVFAVLSLVAAAAILYWLFVQKAALDLWLTIALGSITGGILGNLYDRLGFPGLTWKAGWILGAMHQPGDPVYAVRDWVKVMIGNYSWPNFNVADSMLVCGAILLVWQAFRRSPSTSATQAPAVPPERKNSELRP